jgi:RNA polymerase primary sigma factor
LAIRPFEDNTLDKYFDSIRRFPLLTAEEEKICARMWQKDKNPEGLQRLIEGNLRFVVKEAKKFQGLGLELIDLVSEGNLGLIDAAKRFDPDRNTKFVTFAILLIKQSIFHALADNGSKIRLPEKLVYKLFQFERTVRRLEQVLGHRPSIQEIADSSKFSPSEAEKLLIIQRAATHISTDQPLGDDFTTVGDTLEQDVAPNAMDALEHEAFLNKLKYGLSMLSEKERRIIELHYGLNENQPLPYEKIGLMLSPPVSREYVRRLEGRALAKIRKNYGSMLSHFLGGGAI